MTEEDQDRSALTARLLDDDEEETQSHTEASRKESFLPNTKFDTTDVEADIVLDESQEPEASSSTAEQLWERGEKQPATFRDWPYGVLFHIQFIAVITLGSIYANAFVQGQNQFGHGLIADEGDNNKNTGDQDLTLMTIILPSLLSAATAVILVLFAFVFMTRLGKSFITCSVWTSAISSLVVGLFALSSGLVGFGILSLFSALIGCCYAFAVRRRIPFAAANLSAAISSIRSNGGVTLVALVFGAFMFGWMILWTISLYGVMDIQVVCDQNDFDNACSVQVQNGGWVVPWVFFLFWTQQVFKNLIHTTVAGLVGTWYFCPQEATSFCSKALWSSLFRSMTYSFGSICLGSLLVAILQTLDWIVASLRSDRDRNRSAGVSLLLCCLDCILNLLQNIIEYFNKWAFIYVGVYGYPFITAGKRVMNLFKQRGWTVIINDNLISRALGLMCFIIALMSGIVPTALFGENDAMGGSGGAFAIGFIIALLLSLTIMNIVDSAVSTIIVCFAEAPEELERNHSAHSRDMKEAWNKVYQIRF